jgi:hypothetical protein
MSDGDKEQQSTASPVAGDNVMDTENKAAPTPSAVDAQKEAAVGSLATPGQKSSDDVSCIFQVDTDLKPVSESEHSKLQVQIHIEWSHKSSSIGQVLTRRQSSGICKR